MAVSYTSEASRAELQRKMRIMEVEMEVLDRERRAALDLAQST